ncbi:hypothetical protein [Poriferisphaera sp. WC338]|uniref:FEKKY domain-containing protein n=1 Tax=Poriferisphaera sp. WC338 TaxID=3425129 RepID=UPI003D81A38C
MSNTKHTTTHRALKVLIPTAILTISIICFQIPAWRQTTQAHNQANIDIDNNHLEIRTYGLPHPASTQYQEILLQKYNIHINMVAGCIVDEQIIQTTKAYNTVMEAEITKRFAPNIFDQAWEEAVKLYEQSINNH